MQVLRVFCGSDGRGGNPLGVVADGAAVPAERRLGVAAALGYSETVFVDDRESGELRIFTPAVELPFAGHPLVGTAWLLDDVPILRPPAGEVPVRVQGDDAFAIGRPEWSPPFNWTRLSSPQAVDALQGAPEGDGMGAAWAWTDEDAGRIRARVFPRAVGIEEDEATGSAVLMLCASLGLAIEVRQGRGSRLLARPLGDGRVEIAGRVVRDGTRPVPA